MQNNYATHSVFTKCTVSIPENNFLGSEVIKMIKESKINMYNFLLIIERPKSQTCKRLLLTGQDNKTTDKDLKETNRIVVAE